MSYRAGQQIICHSLILQSVPRRL